MAAATKHEPSGSGSTPLNQPQYEQRSQEDGAMKMTFVVLGVVGVVGSLGYWAWTQESPELSLDDIQVRMQMLRDLISPEQQPPLWLEAIKIPFVILVNYFVFGMDIVRMSPRRDPSVVERLAFLTLRLLFCAMALNCLVSDYFKIKAAIDGADLGTYGIWVALVGVVASANYVNACAMWLLLVRLSPVSFFSENGFKDSIYALTKLYKVSTTEGETIDTQMGVDLKPTYAAFWYGIPMIPGSATWFKWETQLYAFILLPYFFFTLLQLSAMRLGCCTCFCCKACWGCLGWSILVLVTFFLWGHAKTNWAEDWDLTSSVWKFLLFVIWAFALSCLCSIVPFRVSCSVMQIQKKFRLVLMLPDYQPTLEQDFEVEKDVWNNVHSLRDELNSTLPEERGEGFQMDGGREAFLGTSMRTKVLVDTMSRAFQMLTFFRILVFISVRYHTMALAPAGTSPEELLLSTDAEQSIEVHTTRDSHTDVTDAFRLTMNERTLDSFISYQTTEMALLADTKVPLLSRVGMFLQLLWANL